MLNGLGTGKIPALGISKYVFIGTRVFSSRASQAHDLSAFASLAKPLPPARLPPLPAMILPLLRELMPSPVVDILRLLKQSPGMTVNELRASMKMSYMGVKQHCDAMVKKGFMDTWRHPVPHGRPEKIYRLTPKLDPLFDSGASGPLIEMLGHAERIFGPTAAEKLLYAFFQSRAERYQEALDREDLLENKAIVLARLRSQEGCLCEVEMSPEGALRLVDYHCPLAEVAKKYPLIEEIECEMIERVLGRPVGRSVEERSGLRRVIYLIG